MQSPAAELRLGESAFFSEVIRHTRSATARDRWHPQE